MPIKPSTPEETFFARQELERKRSLAQAQEERLRSEERRVLQEHHEIRCPKCGMELLEFSYQRIRIDQCSNCDGIWLDEGELEQIKRASKGTLLSEELTAKWLHAKEREQQSSPEERNQQKALSYRHCPRCASYLAEIEDHGVKVDRCTLCGGIWLDTGEFEAIAGVEHGILARLHKFLNG